MILHLLDSCIRDHVTSCGVGRVSGFCCSIVCEGDIVFFCVLFIVSEVSRGKSCCEDIRLEWSLLYSYAR